MASLALSALLSIVLSFLFVSGLLGRIPNRINWIVVLSRSITITSGISSCDNSGTGLL